MSVPAITEAAIRSVTIQKEVTSASAAVVSCFLVTNTNATVSQKNRVQQQYLVHFWHNPFPISSYIEQWLMNKKVSASNVVVKTSRVRSFRYKIVSIRTQAVILHKSFDQFRTSRSLLLTIFHRLEMAGKDLP